MIHIHMELFSHWQLHFWGNVIIIFFFQHATHIYIKKNPSEGRDERTVSLRVRECEKFNVGCKYRTSVLNAMFHCCQNITAYVKQLPLNVSRLGLGWDNSCRSQKIIRGCKRQKNAAFQTGADASAVCNLLLLTVISHKCLARHHLQFSPFKSSQKRWPCT